MSRRISRGLTEADRALWRAYAATVKALPGRALPPAPDAPSAPPSVAMSQAPAPQPSASRYAPSPIAVGGLPAGLDRKRWTALRRGRLRPERTLDLHGRRAQEAHAAVRGFLADAAAEGLRCVAIITGKGAQPEGGVLRRELPHWLNAPDLRRLLLAAAHPHRADTGAVHLLLKRTR